MGVRNDTGPGKPLRILVADPQTRILERLSTAMGSAGFIVSSHCLSDSALRLAELRVGSDELSLYV